MLFHLIHSGGMECPNHVPAVDICVLHTLFKIEHHLLFGLGILNTFQHYEKSSDNRADSEPLLSCRLPVYPIDYLVGPGDPFLDRHGPCVIPTVN